MEPDALVLFTAENSFLIKNSASGSHLRLSVLLMLFFHCQQPVYISVD